MTATKKRAQAVTEYDTFVLTDLSELAEGKELEIPVRLLTPGPQKYTGKYVKALVSSSPNAYPNRLWIRSQRGFLYPQPWSIKIVKEVDKIPPEFA